jgi:hypothetical protein
LYPRILTPVRQWDSGSGPSSRAAGCRYGGVVIPFAMLAILAFVVMRALMGMVAREERVPAPSIGPEPTAPGYPPPQLRARADDGVRAFLMPAAEPEIVGERDQADESTRS